MTFFSPAVEIAIIYDYKKNYFDIFVNDTDSFLKDCFFLKLLLYVFTITFTEAAFYTLAQSI